MGIIKLKRGNSANLDNLQLEAGEPAFTLDDGKLYIGDGVGKRLINPDVADNATTASRLQTPRKIALTGDVTAAGVDFDGSQDITISTTLQSITLSKITDAGTAASRNIGTGAGQIPVLDSNGKLEASIVPAIAITDTFVENTEAAMLSLDAQVGDVCVRTDLEKSFILKATPASTLANWQELLNPESPVHSVNGKVGAVTITKSDVGLGSVENYGIATQAEAEAGTSSAKYMTPERVKQAIAALQAVKSVAGKTGDVTLTKADVGLGNVTNESKATMFTSPAFTGVPTAPTAPVDTNSTQIATTAFVKAQGYLTADSTIDGGTF